MGSGYGMLMRVSLCWLVFSLACTAALADDLKERTHFGHDITVGPGEQVAEVTCFACSVHVRGNVSGDVTTFGGNIVVEDRGAVGGDVSVFAGNVRLEKATKVVGDVSVFGGRIRRDADAAIGGDVSVFAGPAWVILIFALPLVFLLGFIALIVWLIRIVTRRTPASAAQPVA